MGSRGLASCGGSRAKRSVLLSDFLVRFGFAGAEKVCPLVGFAHLACQEAAIDGYGEISLFHPRRAEEALDAFLAGGISSGPLRAYAENARSGNVL